MPDLLFWSMIPLHGQAWWGFSQEIYEQAYSITEGVMKVLA